MNQWFKRFIEAGNADADSNQEKARKSNLVVLAMPFSLAGFIWGILYFANGLIIPGLIPFCYGILSWFSYFYFAYSKKYRFFRNSQLLLISILPFLLQLSLGGFIPSSGVVLWAYIAPVGALVFFTAQQSLRWFVFFLVLVISAYLLNDVAEETFDYALDEKFINIIFVMNILGVCSIIYAVQYFFVNKEAELKSEIESKNQSLAQQTEKLKESDKLKSQFFANISHEFRTPLTLILGLLNRQIENPNSNSLHQDSLTMKNNASRLLQLINQLLDLSKLESGELKLEIERKNILPLIKNTILLYESLGREKNLKVVFNGNPVDIARNHKPLIAYFDSEKIKQIISNLISNAIKFSYPDTEITVEVKSRQNQLLMMVKNRGPVIPPDKIAFIFNRFYQVDGESTREYEGTGIGLALVKELVELHQGEITAKSNEDATTFTVTIPLSEEHFKNFKIDKPSSEVKDSNENMAFEDPIPALAEVPILKPDPTLDLEVLVVEDNSDIRKYITEILSDTYVVKLAVDGEDGWIKAEQSTPDLIITDVMMPKMNGFDLCQKLKTNSSTDHIPVIMLTAKASIENKLGGLELGADDYLTKPFNEEELLIRIKNLIETRRKLQSKFKKDSLDKNPVRGVSVQQKFLDKLKAIVEKNIDNEQFSVEDLGDQMGMSRSQIHRKLKAITDQSATQFIRNYRLHRAAELLKLNTGNITEIAYSVGFNSQTYFSKSFNDLFNVSPSEYKEKFSNN